MAPSTRSRRRPGTASHSNPTTAEINEGINTAIQRYRQWSLFHNVEESIGEIWQSLRGWHRLANRDGHDLEPFPSWALHNLPHDRMKDSLQLGDDIGYSALRTYFPSAHENFHVKHFHVERWHLLLYFDNLAQLNVRELISIAKARQSLELDDMYRIVEEHRFRRTNSLRVYKNGNINFKAFEFKAKDFQAYSQRNESQARHSYGRSTETVPADDESYRESSHESNFQDDCASSLNILEEDLYDEDDPESNDGEEGQHNAEEHEQGHAEDHGEDDADDNGQDDAEEYERSHTEAHERGHTEDYEHGYNEDAGQIQDSQRAVLCSTHPWPILQELLCAQEKKVSYGRSLLTEYQTLTQEREAIGGRLRETNTSIEATKWINVEDILPPDGKFVEETQSRLKLAASGVSRLVCKRQIDEEKLSENGIKKAKVESKILELTTTLRKDARYHIGLT